MAAHFALRNTASNSAEGGANEQPVASDFEKSLSWSGCWELPAQGLPAGRQAGPPRAETQSICSFIRPIFIFSGY
ncbi:MAG: hypothetical protein US76_03585 [Parcubacteria group bacterium GW2011_GWA2_38_13b]|nr:MAG: hypothetical protein US76_03585 [Parcubacteria group bacterium GW2011_GWA2_38_13b]